MAFFRWFFMLVVFRGFRSGAENWYFLLFMAWFNGVVVKVVELINHIAAISLTFITFLDFHMFQWESRYFLCFSFTSKYLKLNSTNRDAELVMAPNWCRNWLRCGTQYCSKKVFFLIVFWHTISNFFHLWQLLLWIVILNEFDEFRCYRHFQYF